MSKSSMWSLYCQCAHSTWSWVVANIFLLLLWLWKEALVEGLSPGCYLCECREKYSHTDVQVPVV
jgi:hypothetical protein